MIPPKMTLHVGDTLRETGHMRALLFGAYILLQLHHWANGGLPDDDEQLSAITRMSAQEWRKAKPVLERLFQQPGWHHGRVEEDLATAKANYEKRAAAGAEGGKASAKAKQSSSKTVAMLQQTDSNAGSSASATYNPLPKKDAASAAPDPEKELFERGRQVLGKQAGGLISKLLASKNKNIALARAAIEQASTKSDPREYIGAIIRGRQTADQPNWLGGIEGII